MYPSGAGVDTGMFPGSSWGSSISGGGTPSYFDGSQFSTARQELAGARLAPDPQQDVWSKEAAPAKVKAERNPIISTDYATGTHKGQPTTFYKYTHDSGKQTVHRLKPDGTLARVRFPSKDIKALFNAPPQVEPEIKYGSGLYDAPYQSRPLAYATGYGSETKTWYSDAGSAPWETAASHAGEQGSAKKTLGGFFKALLRR